MTHPALQAGVVHLWTVALAPGAPGVIACEAALAQEELRRAAAFRTIDHRRRYVVAHAALRRVLARFIDELPSKVRLGSGPHGKPYLPDHPSIRFNLSHAGEVAMIAVGRDREVGVDVEIVRRDLDVTAVARGAFAAAEQAELDRLAPGERVDAFYRMWTRKEAYIKALGFGLSHRTAGFAVSPCAGSADALLFDEALPGARDHWRVAEIAAPNGYRAALAAEGRTWRVVMHARRANESLQPSRWSMRDPCGPEPASHGSSTSSGSSGDTARFS